MSNLIHASATVETGAEIQSNVTVGANAFIGSQVKLGDGVIIHPNAVVTGKTSIGSKTEIFPFATVGSKPQDLKFKGENAELWIGSNNQIREYSNISIGTEHGGMKTVIGDNNLFMVYTHIAHDCLIHNSCVIANAVQVAGHAEIGSHVVIGGVSGIHQFARIGEYAMIAAGSMVALDVTPFTTAFGNRAGPTGLNILGLKRAGFTSEQIREIKTMYKIVFNENNSLADALSKIDATIADSKVRQTFTGFIRASKRGLSR